jgi:hypothetical protein
LPSFPALEEAGVGHVVAKVREDLRVVFTTEFDRETVVAQPAPGTVIEIASGAVASVEHDVTSEAAEAADEVDGVDEDAHADDGTEPREGR